MFHAFIQFLSPLLQPVPRTRGLFLLLLVTLVTAMLYFGSQPQIQTVIPSPPWDKVAHMTVFGGFTAIAWVALGGRSWFGPVLVAFVIALLDEGMQYYAPGRSADVSDIVADLVGGIVALLVLWWGASSWLGVLIVLAVLAAYEVALSRLGGDDQEASIR